MAELFLHSSVSLDGYIEDARGDIEWMTSDTSFDDHSTALLQSVDGMIFGRKAHALLAASWPTAAERPDATAALVAQAALNALPKYVLTHGAEQTGWANSHAITVADVPGLKGRTARPLPVFAGASAAQALLTQDLLDDIHLLQHPVLLGGGPPLFAGDGIRRSLSLVSTQPFASGAVLQRYRRHRG